HAALPSSASVIPVKRTSPTRLGRTQLASRRSAVGTSTGGVLRDNELSLVDNVCNWCSSHPVPTRPIYTKPTSPCVANKSEENVTERPPDPARHPTTSTSRVEVCLSFNQVFVRWPGWYTLPCCLAMTPSSCRSRLESMASSKVPSNASGT